MRYIDADALLNRMRRNRHLYVSTISVIEQQPSADVRDNVRGRWVKDDTDVMGEGHAYICSNCGEPRFYGYNEPKYNYCPNCGCAMRKENNDERN